MWQLSLASQGSFEKYGRQARREKFLEEMERMMPWAELESLIEPNFPQTGNGRPLVGLGILLRIYFLQQWFNLSEPAAEEALYDSPAGVPTKFTQLHLGVLAVAGTDSGVQGDSQGNLQRVIGDRSEAATAGHQTCDENVT